MGVYGTTRNIEASLIDFITDKLAEYNWNNVNVIKGFKQVYDLELPIISVVADDTTYVVTGIGEQATFREVYVKINIFARSDGQRLDLKDFVVDILKISVPYNEYTIENGRVVSKNYICNMFMSGIDDRKLVFSENLASLDVKDRYRHFLGVRFKLPKVEGVR